MNNDIQYFVKKKDSSEPPEPILTDWAVSPATHVKGLPQCIPSTYECSLEIQRSKEFKGLIAMLLGYARPSSIKRTRKRQLRRAKYFDHTSYEWSQWWHTPARKPRRHKKCMDIFI